MRYELVEPYKSRVEKWVRILRSNEYEQGQMYLKRGELYCCLGVACDISAEGIWKDGEELFPSIVEYNDTIYTYETQGGKYPAYQELPNTVQRYYGVDSAEGSYLDDNGVKQSLTDLNDKGYTFDQIADIIESVPPYLFEEDAVIEIE